MLSTVLLSLVSKSGKTQKEIASELKLSQQRFNLYVTGKRQPDLGTLVVLANYFNVTTDYLLENSAPAPIVTQERTEDEASLLVQYQQLNQEGKEKATDYLTDLVASGRYKKDSQLFMASKEA